MFRVYGYRHQDAGTPRLRRACERCHSRKVRCDIGNGKGPCSNCAAYGDECRLQFRKRKAARKAHQMSGGGSENGRERRSLDEAAGTKVSQSMERSITSIPNSESTPKEIASCPTVFAHEFRSAETTYSNPLVPPHQTASDGMRNSSFISRSAILPDEFPGLDHSNGSKRESKFQLSERELKVLELYHAFDLPPAAVRQSLLEAFFERCWTWMPVVDPDTFLESQSKPKSYLLLQSIFLAGLQMRRDASSYASSEEIFFRAKALLDTGHERDPLAVLASLCMIQWWNKAAPTDVSTNTSRFWVSKAVCLAQQAGLHRQHDPKAKDAALRRRIWWAIYCRDNGIALAHGRPRIINLADCTTPRPSVDDFPKPADRRAQVFVAYVNICGLVGDICELLTRTNSPSVESRDAIGLQLLNWIRTLPLSLRLYNPDGSPRPYDFEIAQLHVPFLSAVTILFRPRSNFMLTTSNTAAIVASTINTRLFEAFQLRDQTYYLSGVYSWYFLVATILQLSCFRIPALKSEAQAAVTTIQEALRTLGEKSPSARNNYRNVQVLYKAFEESASSVPSAAATTNAIANPGPARDPSQTSERFSFSPIALFETFGPEITEKFNRVGNLLSKVNSPTVAPNTDGRATAPSYIPAPVTSAVRQTEFTDHEAGSFQNSFPNNAADRNFPDADNLCYENGYIGDPGATGISAESNAIDGYTQLLDESLGHNWMMDWIDELSF